MARVKKKIIIPLKYHSFKFIGCVFSLLQSGNCKGASGASGLLTKNIKKCMHYQNVGHTIISDHTCNIDCCMNASCL